MLEEAEWSNGPPPDRTRQTSSQWDPVVEECKARPGEWAIFRDKSRSIVGYVRGRYADPRLVVEGHNYRHDAQGRRRVDVWIRWDPRRWSVEMGEGGAEGEEVPV